MSAEQHYHGTIRSVRQDPYDPEYALITIQADTKTKDVKKYRVHDIFFVSGVDKFADRYVSVMESVQGELLKIMVDTSCRLEDNEALNKPREILYKFDSSVLQLYRTTHLTDIYEVFHRDITANLQQPDNQSIVITMLQTLPKYIKQYGGLSALEELLLKRHAGIFSRDLEKIHFYKIAYETALSLYDNNVKKYSEQESDIIFDTYADYINKVVNPESVWSEGLYESYVKTFYDEIIHAQEGHPMSQRDQDALKMYTHISPETQYSMFDAMPKFPIQEHDYAYIRIVYEVEKIVKKYYQDKDFMRLVDTLLSIYNEQYSGYDMPGVVVETKANMVRYYNDFHEAQVFHYDNGVHHLLDVFFSGVANHLYEEYRKKPQRRYVDILGEHIRSWCGYAQQVNRLYYTLLVLKNMHEKFVENRNHKDI